MTDVLRLLATVAHRQAESAADDLEQIADRQKENLDRKKTLRALERQYDSITNGETVSGEQIAELVAWMGDEGVQATEGIPTTGEVRISGGSDDEARQVADNKRALEQGLKDRITAAKEEVDDDQSEVQFLIQVGTSDLQNAENVRSQAEKRLEQQRKTLTQNWGN